jgi:NAD(P)-dependent dehydrogenase (short-subunit alcohol dehydrogenase family)
MEHLVLAWAEETRNGNLRVNLFDPGIVRTRLRADAMPGEDPASLPPPDSVAPQIAELCMPGVALHGHVVEADPV